MLRPWTLSNRLNMTGGVPATHGGKDLRNVQVFRVWSESARKWWVVKVGRTKRRNSVCKCGKYITKSKMREWPCLTHFNSTTERYGQSLSRLCYKIKICSDKHWKAVNAAKLKTTLCLQKVSTFKTLCNFVKFWLVFKIFALLKSAWNLLYKTYTILPILHQACCYTTLGN